MPILKDGKRLARLKVSIGRNHVNPRPLKPIQVARYMQEMKDDLGEKSNKIVSERLEVGPQLIGDFLSLLQRPSEKYDSVWGWGSSNPPVKIGWSMCRRLGAFYTEGVISAEDYDKLVSGLLTGKISTTWAEEILYLKKRNADKSFDECCTEIANLVPDIVESFLVIFDLEEQLYSKISEFSKKQGKSVDSIIEDSLAEFFPNEGELEGVLVKDEEILKVALSKEGRKRLGELCKENKVDLEEIIGKLLEKKFGDEK